MKSYFKFLSRNILYTVIEAVGLIVSIAFVILIGNYVYQQYRLAYSNPIGNRVYAIGNQDFVALSWWDKAEFESKIPEAEAACRVSAREEITLSMGEGKMSAGFARVDPEFFDMFPNCRLMYGSLEEFALKDRCLVSEPFARKLSERTGGEVIGRTLDLTNYYDGLNLTVCGVFKDFDNTIMESSDILANSAFDAFYLSYKFAPFKNIGQYTTLVKVAEGTDREAFAKKVEEVGRQNYDEGFVKSFPVYTLPELYFCGRQYVFRCGNKPLLLMLVVVVLLLLVSAVFNYINLNLALSGKRAREMATRRLLGTPRKAIILKYIAESVLFTAICFSLALLLAWALCPMLDRLLMNVSSDFDASQYTHLRMTLSPGYVAAYVLAVLLVGTLAGLAPAVFSSAFTPIDVVRGNFRRKSKMVFGKAFIVFQNAISVILLAMAILMEAQLSHMVSRPLNARSEGLFRLYCYGGDYGVKRSLIDRLERIPEVQRIGYGRGYPGMMNMGYGFKTPEGEQELAQIVICDEDYFDLLGLKILNDFGHPRTASIWMAKSLADKIGLNDSTALFYARQFHVNGTNPEYVGGVYEDIPTQSASESDPAKYSAVVVDRSEKIMFANGFLIELSGNYKEAGKAIMHAYAEFSEEQNGIYEEPKQSGYISDVIAMQLQPAKTALRLVEIFMILSVLISLLGLLAMSTYYSGENTREIAVRKVFGSDVRAETFRTVKEYMLLVGIAVLIGVPAAVWLSGRYLARYAYRISGYWWVFVLAAVLTFAFAFGSVLWQTLKAAKTNPAVELKKE